MKKFIILGTLLIMAFSLSCGGNEIPTAPTVTEYTVTFDSQSATTPASPSEKTVPAGSTVTSMPSNPVKTGFTFAGWFTETDGGGSPFTESTAVNSNMTVYAKWTTVVVNYTLTYVNTLSNVTGSVPSSVTASANSVVSVAGNPGGLKCFPGNPNTSYVFVYWAKEPIGTAPTTLYGQATHASTWRGNVLTGSITLTGNITLYARWDILKVGDKGPGGGIVFLDLGSYSAYTIQAWLPVFGNVNNKKEISGYVRYKEAAPADEITRCTFYRDVNDESFAGSLVLAKTTAGFTDWYIPEATELYTMLQNIGTIGNFTTDIEGKYWSSSTITGTDQRMVTYNYNRVPFETPKYDYHKMLVRAIRRF